MLLLILLSHGDWSECLHMIRFWEHLSTAQFVNCWFACSLFFHQMLFLSYSTTLVSHINVRDWVCVCVSVSDCNVYGCYNAHCIITIFHRLMCFVSFIWLESLSFVSSTPYSANYSLLECIDEAKSLSVMNAVGIQLNSEEENLFAFKREFVWGITKTTITNTQFVKAD